MLFISLQCHGEVTSIHSPAVPYNTYLVNGPSSRSYSPPRKNLQPPRHSNSTLKACKPTSHFPNISHSERRPNSLPPHHRHHGRRGSARRVPPRIPQPSGPELQSPFHEIQMPQLRPGLILLDERTGLFRAAPLRAPPLLQQPQVHHEPRHSPAELRG